MSFSIGAHVLRWSVERGEGELRAEVDVVAACSDPNKEDLETTSGKPSRKGIEIELVASLGRSKDERGEQAWGERTEATRSALRWRRFGGRDRGLKRHCRS